MGRDELKAKLIELAAQGELVGGTKTRLERDANEISSRHEQERLEVDEMKRNRLINELLDALIEGDSA